MAKTENKHGNGVNVSAKSCQN